MTKYKFIAEMDSGVFDKTERTVTFETDAVPLVDDRGRGLLSDFKDFLLACGFTIDGDIVIDPEENYEIRD